jgi:hypothetical protein
VFGAVAVGAVPGRATASVADDDQPAIDDEDPSDTDRADAAGDQPAELDWTRYAPAAVDAPQLRNVEPVTRIYIDGGYAQSDDLSALPYIAGTGRNWRAAVGGSYRLGRFQLDVELPASQATTLDLTAIPGGAPVPEDARQTALSAGDARAGVQWTTPLGAPRRGARAPLVWGLSLRGRFPTHTTTFQFHLMDGSLAAYSFPYYFHVEPALLFGGGFGRVSFVVNQGLLLLLGPDGDFQGLPIVVPTIAFWDAHGAVAVALARAVALSVEVNAVIQLNRVGGIEFAQINQTRAAFVSPGLQVHLGLWRADVIGRIGVTPDAELVGVLGYGGSKSVTLRMTRLFQ